MKLKKIVLSASLLVVAFSSCRVDDKPETGFGNVNSSEEMIVPAGFDYSTTRSMDFDISTSNLWAKEKVRLDIYDYMPSGGGKLLLSQFMDGYGKASGNLVVPTTLKKLYVVVVTPDGSSSLAIVSTEGQKFSYDFTEGKKLSRKNVVSSSCNSGCSQSINNHSGNLTIGSSDPSGVYCLTGSISGSIHVNRADVTLRICGTATLQDIVLNNGSGLEIVDGSSVSLYTLTLNSPNSSITVFDADLTINNGFNPGGMVTNHGTLSANSLNISGSAIVDNFGTITVANDVNNDRGLTNNGTFNIGGNLNLNGSSTTTNNCRMSIGGNFVVNSMLHSYGLIEIDNGLTLNGGGTTILHSGAMITAGSALLNNSITGLGTTSLVKVSGNTTINAGGSLEGNLEYCDADGVETNSGVISSPATLACKVYIPTNSCNHLGNGSPQIVDSDNDGVSDNADLYPNDPTASGSAFYPANGSFATLAFEDLWPNQGDYDFNDLVVDYRHKLVTNSTNEVVRIESDFVVMAIGGSFSTGFGIQLGLVSSQIASITGQHITQNLVTLNSNGTEEGQTKATVIIFDHAYSTIPDGGGTRFVNTDPTETPKQRDTLHTVITLNSSQTFSALGAPPFNPFIFIDNDRGKELHLIDQHPTDKANPAYFGTGSDNSSVAASRFYKTPKNHPWALNLVGGFDYPTEKTDIVEAYNYFDIWAQSGGVSNTDWYMDFSGYRNAAKIY